MITIIDYGVGNIKAFLNIYNQLNIPAKIAQKAEDLEDASNLILPGVGAFDHAMIKLTESGMRDKLSDLVLDKKIPVIGVCVGMQMLANTSEEGDEPGLGWIDAKVRKFDTSGFTQSTLLPHMGWNDVEPLGNNQLFDDLILDCRFYFLHSYYFHCNKKENIIAETDYGGRFVCAVNQNNIYGVQFHPEKSHHYGTQLLKNFSTL